MLIVTGVTNARTEAANTGIKRVKRTGRGNRKASNYSAPILLASAARTAAWSTHLNGTVQQEP